MKKLVLTVMTALPLMAFAQGFQVNLMGQKQISMANAGVGLSLDGASLAFNPGAMGMLKGNSIMVGGNALFLKSQFAADAPSTYSVHNKNQIAPPFSGYGVFGNGKLKYGIGVYTPFGGLMDWGDDWKGRFALQSLNLNAIFIQPTLSYKFSDQISIGGGFIYGLGHVDLKRAIPVFDSNGNPGQAELKGDGHGYGWNAGIYVRPTDYISIGVAYRSKVKTTVKDGDAIFSVPGALASSFPQPNTFTSTIPLPAMTTLGLGFYLSKKVTLAVDASWVQWSVYKNLEFDYGQTTPTLTNTVSPRNYHDSFMAKSGVQYQASEKFAIRAGVGYTFTPINDGYVTPEIPDADRVIMTAGIGYKVNKHFGIDASFMFEDVKKRRQTNIETGLAGTFQSYVYIPGIALSYTW